MSLTLLEPLNHTLEFGYTVPNNAVNLALLDVSALTPDRLVQCVRFGAAIPENIASVTTPCVPITLTHVTEISDGRWLPVFSLGCFDITETYDASDVNGSGPYTLKSDRFPAWTTSTELATNTGTITWHYSTVHAGRSAHVSREREGVLVGEQLWKLSYTPLVNTTITADAYRSRGEAAVLSNISCTIVDALEGLVRPTSRIPDDLIVIFTFSTWPYELCYEGFASGDDFCAIDVNPRDGHISYERHPSTGVISTRTAESFRLSGGIDFYLAPISATLATTTVGNTDPLPLYWYQHSHILDVPITRDHLQLLARVTMIPPSVESIIVWDTRSRGGGLPENMRIEEDSTEERYFDVSNFDGAPSLENGILIYRVPSALITQHGESVVRTAIERSLAAGISYHLEVV